MSTTTTRSQRIHRGFHRVGAALGGIIILLTAITAFNGGMGATPVSQSLTIAAALAVAAYLLSRAFGWVITGFAGD